MSTINSVSNSESNFIIDSIRNLVIEFNRFVLNSDRVFIIGHKFPDADTIGSAVGFAQAAELLIRNNFSEGNRVPVYIVVDNNADHVVQKLIRDKIATKDRKDLFPIRFINEKALPELNNNDFILITDVNQTSRMIAGDKISTLPNRMIVDHHHTNSASMRDCYRFINTNMSSASEIVYRVLSLLRMSPTPEIATAILSGIYLDTNNYNQKSKMDYYPIVCDLESKYRADSSFVNKLLGITFYEKVALDSVVTKNIEKYGGVLYKFSLSDAVAQGIVHDSKNNKKELVAAIVLNPEKSNRVFLSKLANSLVGLNVEDDLSIDIAITIGEIEDGTISVHGRSTGIIDIGKLFEKIGGGGIEMARGSISNDSERSLITKVKSLLPPTRDIPYKNSVVK